MQHPPERIAQEAAEILLDINAINLRPEEPYTLSAGWASPCYIDCRKVISFPEARKKITKLKAELIRERILGVLDVIAGGETAGIPYAAWLAEEFNLPMVYVRKKPKGYGKNAQIEGYFEDHSNMLLAEDLATDGGSKVSFVKAIREAGAKCSHSTVVFYYGIFPDSGAELKNIGVNLHFLTDWKNVMQAIERKGLFQDKDLDSVNDFLNDPVSWSGRHGGLDTPPSRKIA